MSAKVLGGHIALELKARVASAKSGSLPKRWITAAMGSKGWGNKPLRDPCSSFTIEFKFFFSASTRFANSLVYYGLSLNTGSLVGDPHLMLFISGIIEVPAYLLSAKIIDVLGRRPVISFCLVSGGLACICTTYFPQSNIIAQYT